MGQLTDILTCTARLKELLDESDGSAETRETFIPILDKMMSKYKDIYNYCRINARQQTLITRFLSSRREQEFQAIANLQPGEDDGAVDDDIEEIGDLETDSVPMDFEGFDGKGGCVGPGWDSQMDENQRLLRDTP